MKEYTRLTPEKRMDIFKCLYQKQMKPYHIAEALGVSPSTISREITKGKDAQGCYDPMLAERLHKKQRQRQVPKLKIDYDIWKEIEQSLALRWSPRQISEHLKKTGRANMCAKTIYNYIHFHMKGSLKKLALKQLREKGKSRKNPHYEERRGKLKNMLLIDKRPPEVDTRKEAGNWEGDLMLDKNQKTALLVIVERKTRFVTIDLLPDRHTADVVKEKTIRRFRRLAPKLKCSLTLDQGKENARHEEIALRTKMKVYFCHPSSPWEKGTCENTNRLIRDMLDGEHDFSKLTQRDVSKIARLLNERPRETLGFNTPKEKFAKLR